MKQQPNPAPQKEDKMETEGERWKWTQKAREAQQFAIGGSTSLKQGFSFPVGADTALWLWAATQV